MLEISIEEEHINQHDTVSISLNGGLDSEYAIDLYDSILDYLVKGFRFFFIDCKNLNFISSAGLGIILRIQKQSKEKHANFIFIDLNEEVNLIFKFTGLLENISHTHSKDEAIDKMFHSDEDEIIGEEKIYSISENGEVFETIQSTLEYEPISIEYDSAKQTEIKTNRLSMVDEEFSLEEIQTSEIEAISEEIKKEKAIIEKEELKIKIPFLNITSIDPTKTTILDSINDFDIESEDEFSLQKLSNKKDLKFTVLVVNCGNCGAKIRVKQQGKQKCPSCGYKFVLRQSGSISTIEKI